MNAPNHEQPPTFNRFGMIPAGKTLREYDWTGNAAAKAVVDEFNFKIPNPSRGLFITGNAGVGKTRLAVEIGNYWNDIKYRARKIPHDNMTIDERAKYYPAGVKHENHVMPVEWLKLCNLYRTIESNWTAAETEWVERIEYGSARWLWILDDFGAGTMTPQVRDKTEAVIRTLYMNSATVVITSNVRLAATADLWNEQVMSRLVEMCVELTLNGKDRRGQ